MNRFGTWMAAATLAVAAGGWTPDATAVSPPLSVWIDGPATVGPNTQCAWWAVVSGGTEPYSYTWSGPSANGSSGGEYYGTSPASGSFTVSVTVTDAASGSDFASQQVTVSSSAPMCPL